MLEDTSSRRPPMSGYAEDGEDGEDGEALLSPGVRTPTAPDSGGGTRDIASSTSWPTARSPRQGLDRHVVMSSPRNRSTTSSVVRPAAPSATASATSSAAGWASSGGPGAGQRARQVSREEQLDREQSLHPARRRHRELDRAEGQRVVVLDAVPTVVPITVSGLAICLSSEAIAAAVLVSSTGTR